MTTPLLLSEPTVAPAPGRATATFVLPDRFDVHTVPAFDTWLQSHDSVGDIIAVDAGVVRFIDGHGLQALIDARLSLLDRGGDLLVSEPSVAMQVTIELTNSNVLLSAHAPVGVAR